VSQLYYFYHNLLASCLHINRRCRDFESQMVDRKLQFCDKRQQITNKVDTGAKNLKYL